MSLSLVLGVAAMVLFGIATWLEPHAIRLVAAGLFCLTLASVIGGGIPHL